MILEQRPTQIVACWGYPSANLAGMSLALKAIETIVQSDQWKGRAGAAIDAGSALIQPLTLTAQEDIRSDHPKIGKRGIRVSSILVERTSRLLPTTRPGEIAILPTAHALIPDSTTSTHLAPLRSGMLPDGLGKISIEETIFLLERSPAGTQLLPSIRAAIADTADGIPAIAIMLAKEFGPEDTDHSRLAQMAVATNRVGIQLARELEKDLPARGLVRAISVCGRVIDAAVVADALEVSPAAMGDALDGLCDAGVLERYRSTVMKPALTGLGMDGGRPGLQFQFASRLLRDAARHTLPGAVRRRLHQRLARAMAFQYDRGVALDPADIAAQFADSGDASAAIQWWHRAAKGAIQRSAARSAVRHLTSALASLPDIADADEERPRHDTAGLTRLLGPQLAAVHGNASGSVLSAYERYAELNAGLSPPAPRETFDVLWGVQTFHVVRGDVRTARRMGRLLMDCADAAQHSDSQADDMLILAHRMQGLCAFLTGHPIRAIRHYDWVLSHYVAERHAGLRHTYASDQAALAHAHRAWALIIAGDLPAAGRQCVPPRLLITPTQRRMSYRCLPLLNSPPAYGKRRCRWRWPAAPSRSIMALLIGRRGAVLFSRTLSPADPPRACFAH